MDLPERRLPTAVGHERTDPNLGVELDPGRAA